MKLSIEIELQPEEVPLATDLLKVLKQLTQNVRTRNAERLFKAAITRAEDPALLDLALSDINSLIDLSSGSDEIVGHFFAAFVDVAFNPDLLARRQQSVAFFFYQLLPRLPETVKGRLRERLLAHVIKFLTLPRPVDCNRMEFFAYAECFGIMVKLQYIAVTAAVATVSAMLIKPETTSAAITMLGKTVELSAPILKERCDPSKLAELRAALLRITDDIFRYDISYIEENLGLNRGGPAAPGVGPSPYPAHQAPRPPAAVTRALAPRESFVGHRSTLFAMVYDEQNDGVISSGKDGVVIAWTREGKMKQTIILPKHYACAMDLNPKHRVVYMCGVAKDPLAPPAIIAYALSDKGAWMPRGSILEKPNRLFSCVKALTQDAGDTFVMGESSKADGKSAHSVMLYDASSSSLDKLRPLSVWDEHTDLITSLASYPNGDGIFFSGSRDCTVKAWDRRQSQSIGTFGAVNTAGKPRTHEMMITCLDAYDHMLLSGSLDKLVCAWDLRMLSGPGMAQPLRRIAVDTSAILKVAGCASTPFLAASTLEGLHLVDLDTGVHTLAHAFSDGRKQGRYHDLRWNPGRDTLFAAGDEGRVDLYSTIVHGP